MGNPYLVAVTANTVTDAINEMFNDKKTGLTGLFVVAHDIILSRIK